MAHTQRLTFARPLGRRDFLRAALSASVAGASLYAIGCGGSDDDASPSATSAVAMPTAAITQPASGAIRPSMLGIEHVAGQDNRFAVGLIDNRGKLVRNAAVHVRFFAIAADGVTGTLKFERDMDAVELNIEGAHVHDSSEGEAAEEDSVAFYTTNAPFDVAGRWGVEIAVTPETGDPSSVQVPIDVLAQPESPAIGATPPASRNDTTSTNANAESLCTRDPICGLHDTVIGDLIGKGRPLVVQFSTPAFCETRFCGPVLEVLLAKVPEYRDRVDFVHIEIWQDFQLQKIREAVTEWKLPGEPYTFFIGEDGRVVSRIEAIFSEEELAAELERLAPA